MQHSTFTIERRYDAPPVRVFAAFTDRGAKMAWMGCHADWQVIEFDVREGGRELGRGGPPGGPVYEVDSHFLDVIEGRRLIYSYVMRRDGVAFSFALTTIEIDQEGDGTHLRFTEHNAFEPDAVDTPAEREHGTAIAMDMLGAWLRQPAYA